MITNTETLVSDALAVVFSNPELHNHLSDDELSIFTRYATKRLEMSFSRALVEHDAIIYIAAEGVRLRSILRSLNSEIADLDAFTRKSVINAICRVLENVL